MPQLIVYREEEESGRVELVDDETWIGRQSTNQVVLENPKVSRKHARIVRRAGVHVLIDCGSKNGCYIGDEQVSEQALRHGDEIRILDHRLVYEDETASGAQLEHRYTQVVTGDSEVTTFTLLPQDVIDQAGGAERLQALFEISKTLEEAHDFNAVLVQIMDKAISIMGAERGLLMLENPETRELEVQVSRDGRGGSGSLQTESFSHTLVRKVMNERRPILVLDAQGGDWTSDSVMTNTIHSAICVPLMSRDSVTGVLYVDHRSSSNAFDKNDLAFFTTFSIQAKAAIDSSKTYWELVDSLFRASSDFIVVCSPSGIISQANRAAAGLLHEAAGALVGRPLTDLVNERSKDAAAALLAETRDLGLASGHELLIQRGDGRRVPLSVSSFALRDHLGNVIGTCLIGRDLSQIKGLLAELKASNLKLEGHVEFVRQTFGRFLSDEVVKRLLAKPIELGGQKRRVTVLMSDLRGFTTIGERLPPEQVVGVLNNHLGTMVEVITKHQGTIDEFIGDAILAIFGAPVGRDDDAQRALACAVEMQLAMAEVNRKNREAGLPEVEMGVAVNTGDVVVGNIGSEKRSKYAVVGRHVNLTSRIEAHTVGGQVLTTDGTLAEAGDGIRRGRSFTVRVKGVQGPLTVHEVVGVGAPHHLELPVEEDPLVRLAQPLAVRHVEADERRDQARGTLAELVALGRRGAEIRSSEALAALSNLRLRLEGSGSEEGDFYGKILERTTAEPELRYLRFTAVPPGVRALLDAAREGG